MTRKFSFKNKLKATFNLVSKVILQEMDTMYSYLPLFRGASTVFILYSGLACCLKMAFITFYQHFLLFDIQRYASILFKFYIFSSVGIYTYVFTQANWYSPVYVYKVNKYRGLLKDSKQPISSLFKKKSPGRYPRAYPHGVDAAAYVPHKGYVFLFRGRY